MRAHRRRGCARAAVRSVLDSGATRRPARAAGRRNARAHRALNDLNRLLPLGSSGSAWWGVWWGAWCDSSAATPPVQRDPPHCAGCPFAVSLAVYFPPLGSPGSASWGVDDYTATEWLSGCVPDQHVSLDATSVLLKRHASELDPTLNRWDSEAGLADTDLGRITGVRDELEKSRQHKYTKLYHRVEKVLYCEAFTTVSTEEVVAHKAWKSTEEGSVAQQTAAKRLQLLDLWRHMAPRIVWRQPRDERGTRHPLKMHILRARLLKLKAMQLGSLADDIEGYEIESDDYLRGGDYPRGGGDGGEQCPPQPDDLNILRQMRSEFRAGDVGAAARKAQGRGVAPTHLECVQESLRRQNINTPEQDDQLLASGERQETYRTFLDRVCKPEMSAAGVEAKDLDVEIVLKPRSISKVVWGLARGRAIGINGASVAHMKLLFPKHLHKMGEARRTVANLTAEIASYIVSGDMPVQVRQQQARALLIALYKEDPTADRIRQCIDSGSPINSADIDELKLRPICIPATDICVFFKALMTKLSGVSRKVFRRFQHAVFSQPAAAKSVLGTTLMRDKFPNLVGLLCDIRGAYQEISRLACIKALIRVRGLEQLAKAAWAVLSFPTELLMRTLSGFSTIRSAAGVRQGDPISTSCFCAGLQQMLEFVDEWLKNNGPAGQVDSPEDSWAEQGRLVSAFADDMQVWAVEAAINALLESSTWVSDLKSILNLTFNGVKSMLVPAMDTPLDTQLWQEHWRRGSYMPYANKRIAADSPLQSKGFAIQNVEVGTDEYIEAGFKCRVDKAIRHLDRLMELFRAGGSNDRMMTYLILVSCMLPCLDYTTSLSEDVPLMRQCERFDSKMDECMLEVLDAPPFARDSPEYEFMMAIIHLPVRHGGMGLVPRASLCQSGVLQMGQVMLAIPALPDSRVHSDGGGETTVGGLVPSLNEHLGDMTQPNGRWRRFCTAFRYGRFIKNKWMRHKQNYGQNAADGNPLSDRWEAMGATIEAGSKHPRYTAALSKPMKKRTAEALEARAKAIVADGTAKHSPLWHMATAFLQLPHTNSISWFLQLSTLVDVDAISADSLSRAALLPNGSQFRQMCADRNGWPCPTAVRLRMDLSADEVRLIKPTAEFKSIISRQKFDDAVMQNKLDWWDTWDMYAHNPRITLYSSPERNYRHHSITYEVAAALQRAGCHMDFECRRVHRRSGSSSEAKYKPDGVVMMKVTTVVCNEANDKKYYDLGLTDETLAYILETKGQCVERAAGQDGGERVEAVDVRARAVVQSVLNEFKPDDLAIINQFMIIAAVIGFHGNLSKGLLTFIDNIAMLTAIKESHEEGSDPPASHNRFGHSVRYLRYLEIKRLIILRIQIAAGIAFAEGPETMALRSRGMVGGTLADHVTLSSPRGAFLTMRQFTSILQGARRQLDAEALRAQGPPPERSRVTARAAELMQLLYREKNEVRTRKKKAEPTCGKCHTVGHQSNHTACPLHKNHHKWQAKQRRQERDQQQGDADGDGGAHQHDGNDDDSDAGDDARGNDGGHGTGGAGTGGSDMRGGGGSSGSARGACGGGSGARGGRGSGSGARGGAGGSSVGDGGRSADAGNTDSTRGDGSARHHDGSSGGARSRSRATRGGGGSVQRRRSAESAAQRDGSADNTAVVPQGQPPRRRSTSPIQRRSAPAASSARSRSLPAGPFHGTRSHSHTSNTPPAGA